MEKQKRWHLYLIVAVLALTVYNILPTIFYYSKPLSRPIDQKEALDVTRHLATRVNQLESETQDWLRAFSQNLGIRPKAIAPLEDDPKLFQVSFADAKQAAIFRKYLPQAGVMIPFVPAQLGLGPELPGLSNQEVIVQRAVSTHFNLSDLSRYFSFSSKSLADGQMSPLYRTLTNDRLVLLATTAGGVNEAGRLVLAASDPTSSVDDADFVAIAQQINEYTQTFGVDSPLTRRFFATFTQVPQSDRAGLIHSLIARLETIDRNLAREVRIEGEPIADLAIRQRNSALKRQQEVLGKAITTLRTHAEFFRAGQSPLETGEVLANLQNQNQGSPVQHIDLGGRNPFIREIVLDWENRTILLLLYPEVEQLRELDITTEGHALSADKLNRLLINAIADLGRTTKETINPNTGAFTIDLDQLAGSESVLVLNLGAVAKQQAQELQHILSKAWNPQSADFAPNIFPIADYDQYRALPLEQQRLGLMIYAPAAEDGDPLPGFRTGSIYVVARGLAKIDERISAAAQNDATNALQQDFLSLRRLMGTNGFVGYPAATYGFAAEFQNDFIFELDDYYAYLLAATREDFSVLGNQRYATLEFTNYEQRLLKLNEIETQIHEDLIKWGDEYKAAQISPNPQARYSVPPPTRNALLSNFKLSFKKYFRGDDRKILKWGLDLSGGKSVTIGLRDRLNRPVTDAEDLREAVNQLYTRVNRMGVSEVDIRTEGDHVVLNFPGAQAWSAAELVKGSTMFFHIVNEKFSPNNRALAPAVNTFLQEIWNEAVVTGRKEIGEINQIAWERLGGELDEEGLPRPRSDVAQQLWDSGLRLADPQTSTRSGSFDDMTSSITMMRGDTFGQWHGQTHPLLIIFNHYALDGTNLQNVHGEYDPSRGNVLIFSVSRSGITPEGLSANPQADFHAWTSHFAKDRIAGTVNELYSNGEGWRMAVILNDAVISAPRLLEPLRDHGSVTGNFSQREINQLVADFKAGSLTFTPKILSERNVSPDLGQHERTLGILSAGMGLLAVIVLMISYYRFAGVVASVAVIFNLLIMWGVLQNLGAALTLPGIAGIILTMGMAVDANVLVFERIREEFQLTGRLAAAVGTGYRRAFSAIIDSNLTTLIAALILLHFDAGPIKGFAVTLIIGIASSMFTALFMTRYFFAGWIQNPKHRALKMADPFKHANYDFMSKAKPVILASLVLIIVGLVAVISQRHTIFGMDFTGGYSLSVSLVETPGTNYREEVRDALLASGASASDIQIRELNQSNQLRIQLGTGLEQKGGPFADLPQTIDIEEPNYAYETNPRILWVIQALKAQGLELQPSSLETLENHWNVVGGQFSDAMRNQALWGLGLALLAILIYITFRFEFKFAASAVVALAHDLLITVGILALLHALGVGVQIDLQVVGALMTIIGYSLNDTIVIFDRIREDTRVLRRTNFSQLINHSLNTTLNRTLMTSGTTLVVLLALVVFGGPSIFDFALVMTMGVVFGTFSSLFIAAPMLLYFHRRESRDESTRNAVTRS